MLVILVKLSDHTGGKMKTLLCVAVSWLVFLVIGVSGVQSQGTENYTFLRGPSGAQVCLGRWIPSKDPALPGICDGQLVDVAQFTAISASLTASRLDQMLTSLASIDQKLEINNAQIRQLIETVTNTQASIDQQATQIGELLHERIADIFQALPEEILASDLFKQEIAKLREDILKEVEKVYSARQKPSK